MSASGTDLLIELEVERDPPLTEKQEREADLEPCGGCGGTGALHDNYVCPACGGRGRIYE